MLYDINRPERYKVFLPDNVQTKQERAGTPH
jgi:hypothetical protein